MDLRSYYEEFHQRRWKKEATGFGHLRGEVFASWIGRGKRVLDLGSRTGEVAQHYCSGNYLVCVDIDHPSLKVARERLKMPALVDNLDEALPFSDDSFDVVVAAEVLEHLFFPWRLISEIHRLLKPKGMLIGSAPNAFYRSYRWKFLFGKLPEAIFNEQHIRPLSFKLLREMLSSHFQRVELYPFRGKLNKLYPSLLAKMILFKSFKE